MVSFKGTRQWILLHKYHRNYYPFNKYSLSNKTIFDANKCYREMLCGKIRIVPLAQQFDFRG